MLTQIGAALAAHDPLPLLAVASSPLAVVDLRCRNPLGPPSGAPDRDELLESFLGVPLPETSRLLAALSGDDVLRHRARRKITERAGEQR